MGQLRNKFETMLLDVQRDIASYRAALQEAERTESNLHFCIGNCVEGPEPQQPPAPVEVPMRVRAVNPTGHAVDTRYTWDSQLARMWFERHNRDLYAGWHMKERAIAGGNEWLRDLSAQLGVPLKAVWEGEAEAKE